MSNYDFYTGKEYKVKDLKGIELLPISSIYLTKYEGTKIDLRKLKSKNIKVELEEVHSKQLQIIANNIEELEVNTMNEKTALTKLDLSKCYNTKKMDIRGDRIGGKNRYLTVTMPKKNKNLKTLTLIYTKNKKIDLNGYSNLKYVYLLDSQFTQLYANKCKSLKYAYFYHDHNVTKVDLSKCNKLVGIDVCWCNKVKSKNVKTRKQCKKTDNRGTWWREED